MLKMKGIEEKIKAVIIHIYLVLIFTIHDVFNLRSE